MADGRTSPRPRAPPPAGPTANTPARTSERMPRWAVGCGRAGAGRGTCVETQCNRWRQPQECSKRGNNSIPVKTCAWCHAGHSAALALPRQPCACASACCCSPPAGDARPRLPAHLMRSQMKATNCSSWPRQYAQLTRDTMSLKFKLHMGGQDGRRGLRSERSQMAARQSSMVACSAAIRSMPKLQ